MLHYNILSFRVEHIRLSNHTPFKDPNNPKLLLYSIPEDEFSSSEEESSDEEGEEEEAEK